MIYTYLRNGETYTVNLERQPDGSYQAIIGDQTYTVHARPTQNGGWLLTLDGRAVSAYVAAHGETRYVHVGGQNYVLTVPDTRSPRRKTAGGAGDLTAQMPGQVIDVLVAEGDIVERGQTLVILEAMKMEIRVAAPGDGRVKRLLVAKRDMVERGQLLLEISDTT